MSFTIHATTSGNGNGNVLKEFLSVLESIADVSDKLVLKVRSKGLCISSVNASMTTLMTLCILCDMFTDYSTGAALLVSISDILQACRNNPIVVTMTFQPHTLVITSKYLTGVQVTSKLQVEGGQLLNADYPDFKLYMASIVVGRVVLEGYLKSLGPLRDLQISLHPKHGCLFNSVLSGAKILADTSYDINLTWITNHTNVSSHGSSIIMSGGDVKSVLEICKNINGQNIFLHIGPPSMPVVMQVDTKDMGFCCVTSAMEGVIVDHNDNGKGLVVVESDINLKESDSDLDSNLDEDEIIPGTPEYSPF